jgi:hypothetical protein
MKRRKFLQQTAASIAGFTILAHSASARSAQANERMNLAHIGVGGRGRALLLEFSRQTNPVALCDVNDHRAAQAYLRFPHLPRFQDFREMLERLGKQIDGVVVATPDHTHAVATAAAIRAGKHVYTEKPLTRTVGESRLVRELAAEHKVATSMGNQGTGSGPFRRALELIRGGQLGEIKEVHVWNDQGGPGWEQPPEGTSDVPSHLNWDLWLGPAAQRPYHPRWLTWHAWRDFGTGKLGNWASHTSNLAFMALEVDSLWRGDRDTRPVIVVEAEMDAVNRLSFPRWEMVRWDIPAREQLPPISFYWHNGSRRPGMRERLESLLGRGVDWGDKGAKKWADWAGCLIVGSEGKLLATAHNASFTLLPAGKFKGVQRDRPETVERSRGHQRDWLLACRGGEPAWASFDYSGPLTEFNLLGNVATQISGPLEFDPLTGKFINHEEADHLLHCECREGWSL